MDLSHKENSVVYVEVLLEGIHPKVQVDIEALDGIISRAVTKFFIELGSTQQQLNEEAFLSDKFTSLLEEEPELMAVCSEVMKQYGLPYEILPRILLHVMDEYRDWLYADTKSYLNKQLL